MAKPAVRRRQATTGLPLRTLAPCPFCQILVLIRLWDGTLGRWQRLVPHRTPLWYDVHHCEVIKGSECAILRPQ
jgi:hypothetical protein